MLVQIKSSGKGVDLGSIITQVQVIASQSLSPTSAYNLMKSVEVRDWVGEVVAALTCYLPKDYPSCQKIHHMGSGCRRSRLRKESKSALVWAAIFSPCVRRTTAGQQHLREQLHQREPHHNSLPKLTLPKI